jgi:hypothetical protein
MVKDEHKQIGFPKLVTLEVGVHNEEQTNMLPATNV